MRTWLGSILIIVSGAFAVVSGCGSNPDVASNGQQFAPDANISGTTGAGAGAGANGGSFNLGASGAPGDCVPSTCDELNANCGFVTDTKCGGVVQCGASCPDGQVCGGDGPSRCGTGMSNTGGGPSCTASTCGELKADCGFVTDPKCGGTIQCGTCPKGSSCGLGGPNKCGVDGGQVCVVDPATTCAGRGYTCGQAADNCGNMLNCGSTTCPVAGQSCIQGTCKAPTCTVDPAQTCAGKGFTCGQTADNCGHLLTCGPSTCPIQGWTCGGGSQPGVCGCTGVCSQIPSCPAGTTTTLTGKVYDPAGKNPLYRVLVYVANNPADPNLKSFSAGTTCDVCGASAAGSPLISDPTVADPPAGTYTSVNGTFTLKNVPLGNISVVIQLGRWRRVFPVNITNSCSANTIPDKTFLMPSKQSQGNIPLMAMVTGNADSLECVLRKMGIDRTEFTDPAGGGRVQFYLGTGNAGQSIDAQTPTQAALFANGANNQPVVNGYDMAILACQGAPYAETNPDQIALRQYAESGGRVFTTHYSYTWLYQNNANGAAALGTADNWSEVAKWHVDEGDRAATATGIIDKVSNPKGSAFQGWLEAVGASTVGSGTTNVVVIRHDTDLISTTPGQTQQWLYRNGDNARQCSMGGGTCTSNADCGGAGTCSLTQQGCNTNADCNGKVCKNRPQRTCNVDADCIVNGNNRGPCVTDTCQPDNTCVGSDYTGTHVPLHFTFNTPVNLTEDLTKTPPAVQCGRVLFSDFHVQDAQENGKTFPAQCGNTCATDKDCQGACNGGKCPWGSACNSGADCASSCSGGRCLDPMNAQEKLLEFMIFDLGSCVPPPKTCVPAKTCPAGQDCGYATDGCGGLVACGTCPNGQFCGVGQPPVPNKCGNITCTPATTCPAAQQCGYASDGCNGVVNCGMCPAGQTCNGGTCGGSGSCTSKTCTDQSIECGQAGDQCGKQITCPMCPTGQACIGSKCVTQTCVPQNCSVQGIQCGPAADGCGQMIPSCGMCSAGELCIAGKCTQVK
jgi:hypothetical protein